MSKRKPPRESEDQGAMVDRLLKQLPHADPTLKRDPDDPEPSPRPQPRPQPGQQLRAGPQVGVSRRRAPPPTGGAWWRVGSGVILAAALPFWPYARECGFPLLGYLAAVAVVLVVGVRSAAFTWRARSPVWHLVALGVIASGTVLAAERVLPRVGYARAQARWVCAAEAAAEPASLPSATPLIVTEPARPLVDSVVVGPAE